MTKTKRRKRKPINAVRFTIINHAPEQPAPALPRSRERRFYDSLLQLGVTFRVEGGRVVGYMPNGNSCIYPLDEEIAKRAAAIMRFIAEDN